MHRKFGLTISLFAAFFLMAGGIALAAGTKGEKVNISLTPVPSVKTPAKGSASFTLNKEGDAIHYRLKLDKIENVTMGHIHKVGDDGTPAEILVWLYPSKGEAPELRKGKMHGTLAEGTITAENLSGPLKGKPVKELFEMLEYGKAGVAVHTEKNPGGELWAIHKGMAKGKM